jgi:hypothetical protein
MARFKYLGEPPRSYIKAYGACTEIRTPQKDGTIRTLTPVPPKTEFIMGEDIGHDIVDQLSLLAFRADARYEEIP